MLIIFFVLTELSLIAQTQSDYPVIRLNDELEVREILSNAFVITHKFPWGGNSLVVLIGEKDAVFVDTPYTPEATENVLDWINKQYGNRQFIEINTGYHVDNLGGNDALLHRNIPIIGSDKTVSLLRERGEATRQLTMGWLEGPGNEKFLKRHETIPYVEPTKIFQLTEGYHFTVGDEPIEVFFPGETHAPDNIVVYFPERKILFGGCMLRVGNGTGNRADANMDTWKSSVERLRDFDCVAVIPGHGIRFDPGVIENTISVLP
jgi:glyoxylase-like metal-dependent hydrolase (beta-lactamase superfamily II)